MSLSRELLRVERCDSYDVAQRRGQRQRHQELRMCVVFDGGDGLTGIKWDVIFCRTLRKGWIRYDRPLCDRFRSGIERK